MLARVMQARSVRNQASKERLARGRHASPEGGFGESRMDGFVTAPDQRVIHS